MVSPIRLVLAQRIAAFVSLVAAVLFALAFYVRLPFLPPPRVLVQILTLTLWPLIGLSKPVIWWICRWQVRTVFPVIATALWGIGAVNFALAPPETLLFWWVVAGIGYLLGTAGVIHTRRLTPASGAAIGGLEVLATATMLTAVVAESAQVAAACVIGFLLLQELVTLILLYFPLKQPGETRPLGIPIETQPGEDATPVDSEPTTPAGN